MASEGQNKIYYDINIPFQEDQKDPKFHNYSVAKTEVRMNGPLITDPTNYDLCISKFKIDTECLPVFIPEMRQPQGDAMNTGEMESIYRITCYYPTRFGDNSHKQWNAKAGGAGWADVDGAHVFNWELNDYRTIGNDGNSGIYNSVEAFVTFTANAGCVDFEQKGFKIKNPFPSFGYTVQGHNETYAENPNQAFFQYDYQSVLDRINACMEKLLLQVTKTSGLIPVNLLPPDECFRGIYFKVEDGKISLYVSRAIIDRRIIFKFSPELYKIIGNGFQCIFYRDPDSVQSDEQGNGSFIINYNPFACKHLPIAGNDVNETTTITEEQYFDRTGHIRNETDYIQSMSSSYVALTTNREGQNQDTTRYYLKFEQQYSTLSNWNICKAILICSSSFPIKPEFYPTLKRNNFLTHYKTTQYVDFVRNVLKDSIYSDETLVFDKASTKILDVYYPMSSSGGDIRSSIIYSNDNIESGNKIDMVGGMDLENFDINLKWVDIYGNVYDLYLAPGCSVNIRLCFTRKKILRDELVMAFSKINGNLEVIAQSHLPEHDANKDFDLKKEPKRKRNKVNLPGVLENGLIPKP